MQLGKETNKKPYLTYIYMMIMMMHRLLPSRDLLTFSSTVPSNHIYKIACIYVYLYICILSITTKNMLYTFIVAHTVRMLFYLPHSPFSLCLSLSLDKCMCWFCILKFMKHTLTVQCIVFLFKCALNIRILGLLRTKYLLTLFSTLTPVKVIVVEVLKTKGK